MIPLYLSPSPPQVNLLADNLTTSEKVDLVLKRGVQAKSVPAYDIWGLESLHGVRLWPERCPYPDKCTTIFPAASVSRVATPGYFFCC